MERLRRNKKGFTLIEMIVVIVIIAILVALAVPKVLSYVEDARDSRFLAEARKVYTEVQLTTIDTISDVGIFEKPAIGNGDRGGSTEKEIQLAILKKYSANASEGGEVITVGNSKMYPSLLILHFDNQKTGWLLDRTTTNHNVTKMGIAFFDNESKKYTLVVFKSNGDAKVFKESPFLSDSETANPNSEWYVNWEISK